MMETMIPPLVGMRLRTKNKNKIKKRPRKREGPPKKENKKMREKERRGNATILLPHLCLKVAPCSDPTSDGLISVHKYHPWIGNVDTHNT